MVQALQIDGPSDGSSGSTDRVVGEPSLNHDREIGSGISPIALVADPLAPGGKRMPTLEDAQKGYYTADGRPVVGLKGRYLGKNAYLDEAARVVIHYYAEALQKNPEKAQLILREGFGGVKFHATETMFADPNSGLQESIAGVMLAFSKPVFWGLVFGDVGREASTLYASQLLAQANTKDMRFNGAVLDDFGEVVEGIAARGAEITELKIDESRKSLEALRSRMEAHEDLFCAELRAKQRDLSEVRRQRHRAVTFELAIEMAPEKKVLLDAEFNGRDKNLFFVTDSAGEYAKALELSDKLRQDLQRIGHDDLAQIQGPLFKAVEVPFYAEVSDNIQRALSLHPEFGGKSYITANSVEEAIATQERWENSLIAAGIPLQGLSGNLWFNTESQQAFNEQRREVEAARAGGNQEEIRKCQHKLRSMEEVNQAHYQKFRLLEEIRNARVPMDGMADFLLVDSEISVTNLEWFRQGWMLEEVTTVIHADPVKLGLVGNSELFKASPHIADGQVPENRDELIEAVRQKIENELRSNNENADKLIVAEWLKNNGGAAGSTVAVADIVSGDGQKIANVVLDHRVFHAINNEFKQLAYIQARKEETIRSFESGNIDGSSASVRLQNYSEELKQQRERCDDLMVQHLSEFGYTKNASAIHEGTFTPHGTRKLPMRQASLQLPVIGQKMSLDNAEMFRQRIAQFTGGFGKIAREPEPSGAFPV
jgi:hypothetical protein